MNNTDQTEKISTALVLAAGTGSRLSPLTHDAPKCLTRVNENEILGRLVETLRQHNFKRLVMVVGPFEEQIRDYLEQIAGSLTIEYIVSPLYKTTNNIYSLWLAREEIQEPFVLIESDLIFDPALLKDMLTPGKIAVSRILPWMNGTTVTTDKHLPGNVTSFNLAANSTSSSKTYKTVNIYSFSRQMWKQVGKRLNDWIAAGKVNDYYEAVFAEMIADGSLNFQCVFFGRELWYEVDTVEDLMECEKRFELLESSLPVAV